MALYASGVAIPQSLSATLGGANGAGTNAYNKINQNYGTAKSQFASDAQARGMNGTAAVSPNSYGGSQFSTKQGLDVGNLESALGGGLGDTAYQDTLAQRDFGQQQQLAEETAALNKPDLLQQILGGVGAVGGTAANIYGAYGKNRTPSTGSDPFAGVYGNV
jgi:hypothetical protein